MCLRGPLPDVLPGALPRLQHLVLGLDGLLTTLPASWGSQAAVLPALEWLAVHGINLASGQLPAAWAPHGFRHLTSLQITGDCTSQRSRSTHGLPAEWAAGFPYLDSLSLICLGVSGSLPDAWVSGFSKLKSL